MALRKKLTRALDRVMAELGLDEAAMNELIQTTWMRCSTGKAVLARRRVGPTSEDLLQDSSLPPGADSLLDLIYNEIVVREEIGERPALDEYLERYPAPGRRPEDYISRSTALVHGAAPRYRVACGHGIAPGYAKSAGNGPSSPRTKSSASWAAAAWALSTRHASPVETPRRR